MTKIIQGHTNGGWPAKKVSTLDKCLSEITRLLQTGEVNLEVSSISFQVILFFLKFQNEILVLINYVNFIMLIKLLKLIILIILLYRGRRRNQCSVS